MPSNYQPVLTIGELTSPETNIQFINNCRTVTECDNLAHPLPEGDHLDIVENVGEELPRLVIRGESLDDINTSGVEDDFEVSIDYQNKTNFLAITLAKADAEPLAALTDYLNTTFPFDCSQESIAQLVRYFHLFLGKDFDNMEQRKGGLHGYKISYTIGKTGGMLAFGGQRGTALVSFPGSACALITDWQACYHLFSEVLNGRITRWDGAVDMFEGIPSVDDAVNFYLSGQFSAGGNKPSCSQQGNWIEIDGSGRTFYVGKRKNGKLLRVYEKGKQLGDATSPWVRWELELHNRDRIIPWDVILEPGKYLAAAYACMGWVNEIQERIKTTRKSATISYQHLIHYARQAYGPLINVMLEVEGSPEKVIEQLIRAGTPTRLIHGEHSPAPFITGFITSLAE